MATVAQRVIDWHQQFGRHDLPWQRPRSAYRVWISEIMLQQTQVAAVIPYFERFVTRFPDLASLAQAEEDAVLQLWSGLGYYARARNLHRAARRIRDAHDGAFPSEFEAIAALPGIGRSTAGAVAVFAFGQRRPILDGNVKRVLARYFGIQGYPGDVAVARDLWARAEALLPFRDVEAYTQGLMDLGATVCVRSRPRCAECPLARDCLAHQSGRTSSLPTPRPRRPVPQRITRMLLLRQGCDVLLERRPSAGVWGGLWCFPELPPQAEAGHWARLQFGAHVARWQALPTVVHAFTHFQLDIEPLLGDVVALETAAQSPGRLWLPLQDALGAAVPAPVRALLRALPPMSVERPDRGEQ
jgi:A/G-specific adenine glycosylase